MSFYESVPSPKIADETMDIQHEGDLGETRIPLPLIDSSDKLASAIAANSKILGVKHIETVRDVPAMSVDQISTPFSQSSRKRFRVSRKGIIVAAILGLATGILVGGEWPSLHPLTENFKAANLADVIGTFFAGSGGLSAQQPLQTDPATDSKLSEISRQLTALASDLSSAKQTIEELANGQEQIRKAQDELGHAQSTGQEQIRKAQEQLAQAQSRFAAAQTQTNLRQYPQPSPPPSDGRRLNRRDVYYYPVR